MCIDSRMLSTTVASQCQTLRKLLAGANSPSNPLAVPRIRSSPRVCSLVLLIFVLLLAKHSSFTKIAFFKSTQCSIEPDHIAIYLISCARWQKKTAHTLYCSRLAGPQVSALVPEALVASLIRASYSMRESIHAIRCDFLSPKGTQSERIRSR